MTKKVLVIFFVYSLLFMVEIMRIQKELNETLAKQKGLEKKNKELEEGTGSDEKRS